MSKKHWRSLGLLLITACAPSAPAAGGSRPEPVIPPSNTIPSSSGRTSWVISPPSQPYDYTSLATTRVELTSDTLATVDTLVSTTGFTLSLARTASSTQFSGAITSSTVQAGNRIGPSSQSSRLPTPFSGHLVNGNIVLDVPPGQNTGDPGDCDSSARSNLPAAGRALVLPPAQLERGSVWVDSILISTCAGAVPITLAAARTYRVLGESNISTTSTILVERRTQTHFAGEGAQEQHWTVVHGEGTGSTRIHLDADTGVLLRSEGQDTATISVTSSGRNRQFVQITREQTTRTR